MRRPIADYDFRLASLVPGQLAISNRQSAMALRLLDRMLATLVEVRNDEQDRPEHDE